MSTLSDKDKNEITMEVIFAINQYTDEDVPEETVYADTAKIKLTKDLGIGPVLITQLAMPLTKISNRHNGRGVGIYDAQSAKTVQDCIDLVIKSIDGGSN